MLEDDDDYNDYEEEEGGREMECVVLATKISMLLLWFRSIWLNIC